MRHVLAALSVLYGCSTEFAFETPQTWEDRYTELAAEYGLPDSYPNPGQRPDAFSCVVPAPAGCLVVVSDAPSRLTFHMLGFDGVWFASTTLPATDDVVDWRMPDGTAVWVVGNLLIFDQAYTEIDACDAPNALPPEPARCSF